jgi:hypothetical protein
MTGGRSRETKWMVIGFASMLGSVVLLAVAGFVAEIANH